MQNVTNPTVKTHVVWLDVVRLIAMFTVVCCHCTDPFNFYPGDSPIIGDIKFWGAAYGAFLRPCVPLFVMITGALLLPVREETSIFYKKRILRVFWPFLIWSVIYNLFPWFTGLLGLRPELILDFFPYSGEEVTRQSLSVSLGYIAQIPFNFSLLDVHMWYIYLLIGLYLGNYILLCTISKTIKGHITMYPFIIQSFFSFFFPFPSFLTLQERVFRKRGSRGSIFGL